MWYDDSLDAFGVHAVGGTLGALLTGVFATRAVWNLNHGQPVGLIEGNASVLAFIGQLSATIITWIFSAVVSYAILKLIDLTIGLRVLAHSERQGLDIYAARGIRLHLSVSASYFFFVSHSPIVLASASTTLLKRSNRVCPRCRSLRDNVDNEMERYR